MQWISILNVRTISYFYIQSSPLLFDDIHPTGISLLCTVAEMICANYFPDMV